MLTLGGKYKTAKCCTFWCTGIDQSRGLATIQIGDVETELPIKDLEACHLTQVDTLAVDKVYKAVHSNTPDITSGCSYAVEAIQLDNVLLNNGFLISIRDFVSCI